jgi:hypothetical protein
MPPQAGTAPPAGVMLGRPRRRYQLLRRDSHRSYPPHQAGLVSNCLPAVDDLDYRSRPAAFDRFAITRTVSRFRSRVPISTKPDLLAFAAHDRGGSSPIVGRTVLGWVSAHLASMSETPCSDLRRFNAGSGGRPPTCCGGRSTRANESFDSRLANRSYIRRRP